MEIKMDLEPFFPEDVPLNRPVVISGPCSAESESQMLETAMALSDIGVKIFRAGIWKPRTRPNSFEGFGTDALPWLNTVREKTGMYTSTEVANVKHVYDALKFGVDILWIGARTSANPFAVQEIADALKGVDIPVMVKNPVNPDLELWIGALERLYHAGIRRLAAGHRGFSSSEKSEYRNNPQWQLPIELKRRIPNMPLINDPSHICGARERLLEVSQKAMDLNFDGLIIETHPNPDKAMSDAKQQITPAQLQELLAKLIIRNPEATINQKPSLEELRAEIDKLDDSILEIFEKRMNIIDKIGLYKKENNISILQNKRWDEILNRRIDMGQKKGLSDVFVSDLFKAIHQESINRQTKVMNG